MRCPICQIQFAPDATDSPPFCSARCKTIDLGRWLNEEYGMPEMPDPEDDELPDDDRWQVPPSKSEPDAPWHR